MGKVFGKPKVYSEAEKQEARENATRITKSRDSKGFSVTTNANNNAITTKYSCPRCNGTGYAEQFDYNAHGICFQCNGNGYVETKIKSKNSGSN